MSNSRPGGCSPFPSLKESGNGEHLPNPFPGNVPGTRGTPTTGQQQDDPRLGTVGAPVAVQEGARTPRTRDRLLAVIYVVLSLMTVLSMLDLPEPRDCLSLQSAFQVADLHVCNPVPQSSPSSGVTR